MREPRKDGCGEESSPGGPGSRDLVGVGSFISRESGGREQSSGFSSSTGGGSQREQEGREGPSSSASWHRASLGLASDQ